MGIIKPKLPEVSSAMPNIRQPKFHPFEERLLKITDIAMRPLTTRQIAQYAGISYNATKNNLMKLFQKGAVKKKAYSNRIYWST